MPMIIQHIDAIARKKGSDVLFVSFSEMTIENHNYKELTERNELIQWLNYNNISFGYDTTNKDNMDKYFCKYKEYFDSFGFRN